MYEEYGHWVKKIGHWHLYKKGEGETLCGKPMLGNNYSKYIPEDQRTLCRECQKEANKKEANIYKDSFQKTLPWETHDGWEHTVCEGIYRHNLAPREARAILKVAGLIKDRGGDFQDILFRLISLFLMKYNPELSIRDFIKKGGDV